MLYIRKGDKFSIEKLPKILIKFREQFKLLTDVMKVAAILFQVLKYQNIVNHFINNKYIQIL